MASFNRVVILGNLGQNPELRFTTNQTAVCTLNIATTEYRTGADGQRVEQTEWHRVVAFSKQAENCHKYLAKGRSVLVEGRLQTRSWEDQKTGQKRYTTEIVAQTVQFIGGGQGAMLDRGVGQLPQPGQQAAGGSGSPGNYGYGGGGGYGAGLVGATSAPSYSGGSSSGALPPRPETPRRFESDPIEPGDSGDFGGVPPPGLEEIPF